jgi:sodium transport system ATP-binding protein
MSGMAPGLHPVIQLRGITRRFSSDRGEIIAVNEVSLGTYEGEVYGLLGPNGAGKTTTLRILLGLLAPTSGDVEIMGTRVSEDPRRIRQLVGLVSASAGLYQWLTPLEILRYFASGYSLSAEQAAERISQLTELMGLTEFLNRRAATLSTGQKQRVNLARALIHDPPVVLLDEPTRGLDVVGSQVVFDFVRRLRNAGKAVIVCTHQLDEAQRLCDRFGLLHHGRLRHEGTLEALREQTGVKSLVEMFLQLLGRVGEQPSEWKR